jgi:hypothetical protein
MRQIKFHKPFPMAASNLKRGRNVVRMRAAMMATACVGGYLVFGAQAVLAGPACTAAATQAQTSHQEIFANAGCIDPSTCTGQLNLGTLDCTGGTQCCAAYSGGDAYSAGQAYQDFLANPSSGSQSGGTTQPPAACSPTGYCANFCPSGDTPLGTLDCQNAEVCCPVAATPSAGGAPASEAGTTATTAPKGGNAPKLDLPPCISTGNCTLDDIVKTGANFANLLTQVSAALFFATFIYGGAMYLLSFGDKSRVEKGKKAITGAAIGMAIVLGAWTLVTYIAGSLLGKM